MKIKRNIFILFIAIILLIATYVVYNKDDGSNAEGSITTESSGKKILDISQENIGDIEMKNVQGSFHFQKVGDQWTAIEPADLKFDQMRIDGILYTMANLDIMSVVDDNPSDIEQFGLKDPSFITIKLKDGTEDTLQIGSITALKDGYYVKLKNQFTVYKVNTGVGDELLQGNNDFRDKRLFDFVEDDFNGIQIKKEDKIVFDIDKDGDSWKVEPQVDGDVNLKKLEPVITTFSYLCVSNYIENNAKDFTKYGLNKPVYTINVKTTKFNKTLYLGNEFEKENVQYIYGRIDGSSDVFSIKIDDISFIYNPSRSGFSFLQ